MWVAPVGGRNTGELQAAHQVQPHWSASMEALKGQRGKAADLSWTNLIIPPFLSVPSTGYQNLLMTKVYAPWLQEFEQVASLLPACFPISNMDIFMMTSKFTG